MTATAETGLEGMRAAFARHETFHPRYGWLRKAYEAANRDTAAFLSDHATTNLGVGKNMVRAIRYWGLAYKMIEEFPADDNPRLTHVRPARFGNQLLGNSGWDPYLEEPGSLWLLHWLLLRTRPECRAPAWWAIFNSPRSLEFSDGALVAELRRFCDEHGHGFGEIAESSLMKDARCLLRMYGNVTQGRDLPEDSIDSPFAELDLIRSIPGSAREFTINRGPKRTLPDEIVVWSCLDHLQLSGARGRTASIASLSRGAGSPGRAFALTETALADAVGRFSERHTGLISLTDAAGIRQLVSPHPDEIPEAMASVLDSFYGGRR